MMSIVYKLWSLQNLPQFQIDFSRALSIAIFTEVTTAFLKCDGNQQIENLSYFLLFHLRPIARLLSANYHNAIIYEAEQSDALPP